MEELYMQWTVEFEMGETTEDFEDWYSGKVSDAEDRCDMER